MFAAHRKNAVRDWVDSSLFTEELKTDIDSSLSVRDSSKDLVEGCEVTELGELDTIPAELMEHFK